MIGADIIQCHRLWLKPKTFISHISGGQKPKVKILEIQVSDEGPLFWFADGSILVSSHGRVQRERAASLVFYYRDTNPIYEGSKLMT